MSILENRVNATIGAFLLTGLFILLEHFRGGVVAHHLLAREDLPEISNWWGLLTIPLLTWVVYSVISRRSYFVSQPNQSDNYIPKSGKVDLYLRLYLVSLYLHFGNLILKMSCNILF